MADGQDDVKRLEAKVSALHRRLDELEDGNGRPGFRDVVKFVFGDPSIAQKGLADRMSAVEGGVRSVDGKLDRMVDRVFYVIIGLGLNLITQAPEVFTWIAKIMKGVG